ncbi:MAG: site-2 protease family protein, partial [Eubacterium sp.]
ANPVPVNPARLKHPRRDMALIALAGPVSNLLMGFVWIWIYYILLAVGGSNVGISAVAYFFNYAAQVNVMLAVFNILPIPPLDGSKIFSAILPDKIYFKIMQYDRYIMIALMILLFTGLLNTPISWLTNLMIRLISIIPALIFG